MHRRNHRLLTMLAVAGGALLFGVQAIAAQAAAPPAGAPRRPSYPVEAAGTTCPRASLKSLVDGYSAALAAHDSRKVKLAGNVRFTENAELVKPGQSALWKGAGAWDLRNDLIDTQKCGTVSWGLIQQDGRPVHAAIRLQTNARGEITEIEHIVSGEKSFFYNPKAIMETAYLDWETILAPDERSSREAMAAAANDYFAQFDEVNYVSVPYADRCDRWENGGMTTRTHVCKPPGRGMNNHPQRRIPLVDLEAGIVAAFVHFGRAWDDVHMFKMQRGQVAYMMAVLVPDTPSDGWLPGEKKPPESFQRD